jgi:small glutamine-rich tetratricopeptide repeat-containing protein alpha
MFPGMGGPGGMDLGSFLNNPALMNMATTMLQDPNMQAMMGQMMGGAGLPPTGGTTAPPLDPSIEQMMGQMMGGGGGGIPGVAPGPGGPVVPGGPVGTGGPGGPTPDMASLLQAGQQLAQQMQQSNPELVEQLRRQMGGGGGPGPFPPPPGNPPQ